MDSLESFRMSGAMDPSMVPVSPPPSVVPFVVQKGLFETLICQLEPTSRHQNESELRAIRIILASVLKLRPSDILLWKYIDEKCIEVETTVVKTIRLQKSH